jgi:protein-disulfide isomerase
MRRILLIAGAVFVAAGIGGAVWMNRSPAPTASVAPGVVATASGKPIQLSDNDMILGNRTAPITIIEYASLTCPHCADFTKNTLPDIRKNWIDTGKAKLVFRDYPLDAVAVKAAVIAHCGGPERFFGFIDVLFSTQETWARAPDPVAAMTRLAKLGGLSESQVQACLADEKLTNLVVGNRLVGEKEQGVDSTPTFFINGQKVVGEKPYSEFNALLAAAPAS